MPDIRLRNDTARRGDHLHELADIADEILAQPSITTEEMQELASLLRETN